MNSWILRGVILHLLVAGPVDASAQRPSSAVAEIPRYLRSEIQAGRIVGAQVRIAGPKSAQDVRANLGTIGLGDPTPVSDETVFCIASCSKPVASHLIFALIDQGVLKLDQPSSDWIPELNRKTVQGSSANRAPNIGELLCHRGGIYSQKRTLTREQIQAIRDFTKPLDESVSIIAKQPLLAKPGQLYAYSGAGYCLLGKIAELASEQDFESLLQSALCEPLGMKSTTYFPNQKDFDEIAFGGESKIRFPHQLGTRHKLPLIGGSLYTNADDLERFVNMVSNRVRFGGRQLLRRSQWDKFVSVTESKQPYGYGWLHTRKNGTVVALSHNGALAPYQSAIRVRLDTRSHAIVLWTLANPANGKATSQIRDRITSMLKNL